MTEEKFVEDLKKNNPDSFKKLYEEYAPKIYGVLINYVNHDEIEDALQEVFLRIIKGINGFKGRSKLSTWIYRIAVNVGKNYTRKYQRSKETSVDFEDETDQNHNIQAISNTNVKNEVLEELDYQMILNIMEKLNEEERLLIKLRDIDGMSYNEIAEIMEIPLGTVKSKLHYTRKKLRQLIEEAKFV
ncbi:MULTISPECIES: RNA polymerase sigma factor [Petrotoga]|uniref:RNA polymerase RpoE-like sigma-24 subunit n=2 Tax=Petrotoga sibirica TaxID=156202 RepID=A0A4R8EEE8_9BACT|nr:MULTISPECIES: sigma-70 family RNA polymerase sigma factor [Petrotoga]POZ87966.1 RNA polymerase sigma 70 [Petrotoga sibirica DSM 13575]POZ90244.1 RNA polymerase sigma 70 [Petrotoga sp. SL27]TDX10152.1 RNA polymerase RpoE-like sigma-24 subunit [Petrotoga sibirica]